MRRYLPSVVALLVLTTVGLARADDRASTLPVVAEHRYRMLASGSLAEVPIHMAYQPRWWFKVELFLTGV